MVILDEQDYLAHYGILRRSGRYPWGTSGWGEGIDKENFPRNATFLDTVGWLRKQGLTESQIAQGFGISINHLRAAKTVERAREKQANITMAQRLKDKGMSNPAIAERMGLSGESAVRALLAPGAKDKSDALLATADALRKDVDAGHWPLDVGTGIETSTGISEDRLKAAVYVLLEEGYQLHPVNVPQIGTGYNTRHKVLVPPGVTQKEAWEKRFEIKIPTSFSPDGGRHFAKDHPLVSIDPKRLAIRYHEDGGGNSDGVIYIRPGLKDLSMGGNNYAQVRIKVGDKHYLKGMAVYKDDLPDGVDLLFNTAKSSTGNKLDALKPLADDKDLPFESVVRQVVLDVDQPTERVESAITIVNAEGDWKDWTDTLSSQFLSKQSPRLAKEQLDKTFDRSQREFDEIMRLTNPAVRHKLLMDFADGADSAAVHLHAASLPRQSWKVILPVESLKPNEVYAPTYKNGESVVLIRFPHGGPFEIPELRVNNRHPEAKRSLKDTTDAIGIHPSVAAHLSGADFDGDTVQVIPNGLGKVRVEKALSGLKGFDPQIYKLPDDSPIPRMTKGQKAMEMGSISNLITDMTIRNAPHEELARAVRHSMVVIDAEKHNLNYRQSAIDNGIKKLQSVYQSGHKENRRPGASTLISRKGTEVRIPQLTGLPEYPRGAPIDRETGRKLQIPTGKTRRNKDGSVTLIKKSYNRLALTEDAHELSSGTLVEHLYAEYSNKQKDIANRARREALNTPPAPWNHSAKEVYAPEVASLSSKLALAKENRVRERHAQVIANAAIKAKMDANPNLDGDSLKKIKYQEQTNARLRVKVDQRKIEITPEEWDAIQAGAISNSMLNQILAKADMDKVRELATPRPKVLMTTTNTRRAQSLLSQGYTRAEVASRLGVSVSTLDRALSGKG